MTSRQHLARSQGPQSDSEEMNSANHTNEVEVDSSPVKPPDANTAHTTPCSQPFEMRGRGPREATPRILAHSHRGIIDV